jgi:hypothetical protein
MLTLLATALPMAAVQIALYYVLRDHYIPRLFPHEVQWREFGIGWTWRYTPYLLLFCLIVFHLIRLFDRLWLTIGMTALAFLPLVWWNLHSPIGRTLTAIGIVGLAIPFMVEILVVLAVRLRKGRGVAEDHEDVPNSSVSPNT